jgi:hypothetical protein
LRYGQVENEFRCDAKEYGGEDIGCLKENERRVCVRRSER